MANLKDLIVNGSARVIGNIYGNLKGTADKAVQDENGNNISSTYLKNTGYSLLESKYSEVEITNSSWLKSNGQWNTRAMYPELYDKINTSTYKKTYYKWVSEDGSQTFYTKKVLENTDFTTTPIADIYLPVRKQFARRGAYIYVISTSDLTRVTMSKIQGEEEYVCNLVGQEELEFYLAINVRDSEERLPTEYDYQVNTQNKTFMLPLKTETSFVIEKGTEKDISYIIYQNGYCEQWGCSDNVARTSLVVNYLKEFADTNYFIAVTDRGNGNDTGGYDNKYIAVNGLAPYDFGLATTGFRASTASSTNVKYAWKVSGYLKEGEYTPLNLYFYVGDTIKNQELIDISQITTALSNKVDINSKVIDGQWVGKLAELSTAVAVGTYNIDLTEYLPKDNYQYEVMINIKSYRSSSSGNSAVYVKSSIVDIPSIEGTQAVMLSAYSREQANIFTIPIDIDRIITMQITFNALSNNYLTATAYRRIGTNE